MRCSDLPDVASDLARLTLRVAAAHLVPPPASVKPDGSLVTAADWAIERELAAELLQRFPSSTFRGEENQAVGMPDGEILWTIDPIDGTTDYVAGLGYWATVLSAECAGSVRFGCVALPCHDLVLYAAHGSGAFALGLEERRLAVAPPRTSLFALGTYVTAHLHAPTGLKLRGLGSLAADLAFVALGRITGALVESWNVWDVLGAVLILEEAGHGLLTLGGAPVTADSVAHGDTPAGAPFVAGPPDRVREWVREYDP